MASPMADDYRCRRCRKTFPTKKALKQHNRSKHRLKGLLVIGLYLAVFTSIAGIAVYSGALSTLTAVFQSTSRVEDEGGIVMHIHPELAIVIDEARIAVPDGIGMKPDLWKDRKLERYGESGMSPIHTHDDSGKIHIESKVIRDYTLGEFFDIWGIPFNSTCIMDRCSGGTHVFEMYVDGKKSVDFRDHVLKDMEQILLQYRKI